MEIDLKGLGEFFKLNNGYLISTHIHPDGDAIGSSLALGWMLERLGKDYRIIIDDTPPEKFDFLYGFGNIGCYNNSNILTDLKIKHVILVDSTDLDRCGRVVKMIPDGSKIINIDHHESNDRFGDISFIDIKASSTAEIIYNLISSLRLTLDEKVASHIYTGIAVDTGSFRFSNTSSKVLTISALMVSKGARADEIANNLYCTKNYNTLKMLGKVLSTLDIIEYKVEDCITKVGLMCMEEESNGHEEDFEKVDTEGFVNYPLAIKGVEVALFLNRDAKEGKVWVSLRSRGRVNVSDIAKVFNGGGHPRAAGCNISGKMEEAKHLLFGEIEKHLFKKKSSCR